MNNYPNFKNYNYTDMYNKMNDNCDNAYENMYNKMSNKIKNNIDMFTKNKNEMNDNSLYDPYNGLIRGNLFKNLYDPYKIRVPYDIKPMNEQAELLTYIDALCFAMTDLNLYLDIYANDKSAIDLFNQYRVEKDKLTNEYENKYGPITLNSDSLNSYPWAWDDMPWPWDN